MTKKELCRKLEICKKALEITDKDELCHREWQKEYDKTFQAIINLKRKK